jgi:hypothetical protein
MPPERPGAATAAAVLAIIYGSVFTLCGLCCVFGAISPTAGVGQNPFVAGNNPQQVELQNAMQNEIERNVPAYQAFQLGSAVAILLTATMLLIGGIGVLSLYPWARALVIIFALVAIATLALIAFYYLAFFMPALTRAVELAPLPQAPAAGPAPPAAQVRQAMQLGVAIIMVGVAIVCALFVIYLGIIIILLTRPHVRAAFAAAGRPYLDTDLPDQERHPGGYDDDWDRLPPRE